RASPRPRQGHGPARRRGGGLGPGRGFDAPSLLHEVVERAEHHDALVVVVGQCVSGGQCDSGFAVLGVVGAHRGDGAGDPLEAAVTLAVAGPEPRVSGLGEPCLDAECLAFFAVDFVHRSLLVWGLCACHRHRVTPRQWRRGVWVCQWLSEVSVTFLSVSVEHGKTVTFHAPDGPSSARKSELYSSNAS